MSVNKTKQTFREKHSFFIILGVFILFALYAFVSREIFGIPFYSYLAVLGVDIIWVNGSSLRRAVLAKHWPSSQAVLTSLEAVEQKYASASSDWRLDIQYQYTVSGISYVGDNYNWVGRVSSSKERIEKLVNEIEYINPFYIKYDPSNHANAVVVPEVSWIYFAGVLGGLFIAGIGVTGVLDYLGFSNVAEYLNV